MATPRQTPSVNYNQYCDWNCNRHERCHVKHEHSEALDLRACTRAKEHVGRNKEVCFYVPPMFDCVLQYSTLEGFGRIPVHEHLMKRVCDRRALGDMYIEGWFRNLRPIVKVDLACVFLSSSWAYCLPFWSEFHRACAGDQQSVLLPRNVHDVAS